MNETGMAIVMPVFSLFCLMPASSGSHRRNTRYTDGVGAAQGRRLPVGTAGLHGRAYRSRLAAPESFPLHEAGRFDKGASGRSSAPVPARRNIKTQEHFSSIINFCD